MSITHVEVRRHPVWRDEVAAPVRSHSPHVVAGHWMALAITLGLLAAIAAAIALALR